MTADEFFWWFLERQHGLTERTVRSDPVMTAAVEQEVAGRSAEVFERVLAALQDGERHAIPTTQLPAEPLGGSVPAGRHTRPGQNRMAGEGLTVAGAAHLLGCSPSKVYRLFDAGELPGHRVGGKRVIPPASVEEYKARNANARGLSLPPAAVPKRTGFRHLRLPGA